MATTLRGFQNEIEQIHDRELAKQRAEARIALDKDKHKEKGPQAAKGKDVASAVAPADERSKVDEDDTQDALQRILVEPESSQKATDYLALLLLRNRGEIVVRLGTHPPLQQLFEAGADALPANTQGRGSPISSSDLEIALKALEAAADSVGAK
ncbi:hypothetical protein FRC09_013463, partial [Ceratobasidium sp. 395]